MFLMVKYIHFSRNVIFWRGGRGRTKEASVNGLVDIFCSEKYRMNYELRTLEYI